MPRLKLELTYDIDHSKKFTFYFTRTQLQKLHSLLSGPEPKTSKIENNYFSYHGSYLGHNTDKTHASKYSFHEDPSEIKNKIKELLLQ
ncbi:hypothetical protein SAMN05216288_2354 [Pseudomonas punonensis]|uniref:Uncharacterized protein n=1 Tax=Phytopseudomonas punonensis TaxID=1220495 RepID=A0A1M7D5J5_9GAMM|nr:hypothetical protein SAMN05216288_2354 [Pseudomonas punonensis]